MASVPPRLGPWLERCTAQEQPLALTVGTMNFGTRPPVAEAERIAHRALERGLRFFDTANLYGSGEAERILGRVLRGRCAEVGLASKVGLARVGGKPEGLAAPQVERAVEGILRRLGTEYVDLLYARAPAEVEYLDFTSRHPLHTTLYNPLAGGLLSGRYTPGAPVPPGSRFDSNRLYQRRYFSERMLALTDQFATVARDAGLSLLELAYAWLVSRPGVDSLVLDPASVEHVDVAVEACARCLPEDVLERVESVY